jgi:DNA-binding CsgD family transcriptional regulator
MTTERIRRKRGRPPHPDILTPREWQVLDLLRQNLTNEQIAQRLDISLAGAKDHVSEILTKLGLTSRDEAAAWEPEAVPARPWWAVALATLRRAWPLAGAAAAIAVAGALAWFILGASAGEDSDAIQNQSSPSPDPNASPAASPTPEDLTFAPLSISNPEDTKLLFTRRQTGFYGPGELWMSDLDGADPRVLIDESAVVDVIGVVAHWQTGNPTLYFVFRERLPQASLYAIPRGRQTVSMLDLVTGDRAELLEFEIEGNQVEGAADVAEGGRYIAYTDVRGLAILDTGDGQVRRVLDSKTSACGSQPGPDPACSSFLRPSFSPDGNLLAMNQVFYEGGDLLVADVNAEPPRVTDIEYDGLYPFTWAPSGNSLCAVDIGAYDSGVGLIISRAPDWQPEAFLTDYSSSLLPATPNLTTTSYGHQGMWSCVWLDESTVAVMHNVLIEANDRPNEILILDLETSDVRNFREHNEFMSSRSILAIPDRGLVISQFRHHDEYPDPIGESTTPEVVDAQTGARAPILTTQDRVVAAVPTSTLAR